MEKSEETIAAVERDALAGMEHAMDTKAMETSNYLHAEDDLKAGQTDSSGNIITVESASDVDLSSDTKQLTSINHKPFKTDNTKILKRFLKQENLKLKNTNKHLNYLNIGEGKPLNTIAIEANATVVEEKEVDETDNTHLSLVLIKIRKGIGIKHSDIITIESIASAVDLSSDTKQLTSVNHKHFTTKMLKIQQEKIDTRTRENRKIATKNLQLDTYSWIKITYFYFYFSLYM